MREILFKAKRLDNGEWIEGALLDGVEHCLIGQGIKFSPYTEDECKIVGYKVDRNTLCQFTGLTDKNGNKIWENDIVKEFNSDGEDWCLSKVIFENNDMYYGWMIENIKSLNLYKLNLFTDIVDSYNLKRCESIGNIFDNADLLGKE